MPDNNIIEENNILSFEWSPNSVPASNSFYTSDPLTPIAEEPLEYNMGYPITLNEPTIDSEINDENGYPMGFVVQNPAPSHWITAPGDYFWSRRYEQFFVLHSFRIGSNVWVIRWLDGLPEDEIQDNNHVELEVEYDEWEHDTPFEYLNRWYVVMTPRNSSFYAPYEQGNVWFSEYHDEEFRLGRPVRASLFGSNNAFRIEWVGENINTDDGYSVEVDDESAGDASTMMRTNIGRRIPLISIEQEFSGNGDRVAREMYEAGFGVNRNADSYHMSIGRTHSDTERFAFVETDSSCGYELIYQKVNLRDAYMTDSISEAQRILKRLKEEEQIRLSARCGFHVHVDVKDWSMKEIVSAYHLWNYLEDTVFRFSSAFWEYHREEEVGGGYATTVPKGHESKVNIGRVLSERRDALNFSHILRAKSNCMCGAGYYEDWANCTCSLAQPTLEFRVFNATTNQRKIRAYLAFCVAFVNAAENKEFTPDVFPEMRWRGTNTRGETWEADSAERIKFILDEFPLTNSEQTDIMYCFRNSSLKHVVEVM